MNPSAYSDFALSPSGNGGPPARRGTHRYTEHLQRDLRAADEAQRAAVKPAQGRASVTSAALVPATNGPSPKGAHHDARSPSLVSRAPSGSATLRPKGPQ